MKVLLTGFEPFGGECVNPALEIVHSFPDMFHGARILKLAVPVVFGKASDMVCNAMRNERPDIVICLGLSGGRSCVTPEMIAVNFMNAEIPDNEGGRPACERIVADGPDGLFSNLPVMDIAAAIRERGLPSQVSFSAGTYVCNSLMYRVLFQIRNESGSTKGGFIHVPYLPSQVSQRKGVPSMSFQDMCKSAEIAVAVALGVSSPA